MGRLTGNFSGHHLVRRMERCKAHSIDTVGLPLMPASDIMQAHTSLPEMEVMRGKFSAEA